MRFTHLLAALIGVGSLACGRADTAPPQRDTPGAVAPPAPVDRPGPSEGPASAEPADADTGAARVGSAPKPAVRAECDTVAMLASAWFREATSHVTADTIFHEELTGTNRRGCVAAVPGVREGDESTMALLWPRLQDRGWPASARLSSDGPESSTIMLWRPMMICSFSVRTLDYDGIVPPADVGREWLLVRCANEMAGDAEAMAPLDPMAG